MEHNAMLKMVRAMRIYGGSFVVALSDCFVHADATNLWRLENAFPEIVDQYTKMAEHVDDAQVMEDDNEPF